LLAFKLVLVTALIFHTIVILVVPKVKMVSTVATSAKSKKLNAKLNVHVTNNVHTDVHAHHGAYQKNKFVKLFGNMKTNNALAIVIPPEAKCSICVKMEVLVNLHVLTHV